MSTNWRGRDLELEVGGPGHGGFCVARHEGRVVFVRHALPGERVRARVTEDRGGSFCRADAVEIYTPAPDRIPALCPVSGPGGAGCCDFSHATPAAVRRLKAQVVSDLLRRIAHIERDVEVEELPGTGDGTGWRTRVRLAVDPEGRAGYHRYRSSEIVPDLRCPQMPALGFEGLAQTRWRPGGELRVVLDDTGTRHVVEVAPAPVSRTGRRDGGRRGVAARRAAAESDRDSRVVIGDGRALQRVSGRPWRIDAADFWQAHRGAAQTYSDLVREWAAPALKPGGTAFDLYGGVGVFAAALAEPVGAAGMVVSVESAPRSVSDAAAALEDLGQVRVARGRVERVLPTLTGPVGAVVLDPPRSGAGAAVISAVRAAGPARIVHIGCDPAAFARDLGLYRDARYGLAELRAFDAFPLTHHVECVALLERS